MGFSSPQTPTPLKKALDLSRDQRIEIQALRKYAGWTYQQIALYTPFTLRQIQYACSGPVTPQKSKPHRKKIRTPDKERIKAWLLEDFQHRKIPWADLRFYLPPDLTIYSEWALTSALHDLGFARKIRKRRYRQSIKSKRERVEFARAQLALRPNPENWENIIFSDETWATTKPMQKSWLTIHDCEDLDTFALIRSKPHGWMFWGQFAGRQKGPCFFWEKEWGGISAHKYIFFILPLVTRFYRENNLDIFQQDNAPSHRAAITKEALETLEIQTIHWPANSPDLNPIEMVWFTMKAWIEKYYDLEALNNKELRDAILEAWDHIDSDFLLDLAHSVVWRLNEVIRRGGENIYQ